MIDYPEYVKVGDKKYKINTDFRTAIECDVIGRDNTIGDYERALAIIYKLFGDEGLDDADNHNELLRLAKKYLLCGNEMERPEEEPNMSYEQDMDYIEASFMSDFRIDLSNSKMHWWKFNKLINGLSNSELGNCCVLNRVRNLRDFDIKQIKDPKEKRKIQKAKEQVALKKNDKKELTSEELNNINDFYRQIGIRKE